MSWNIGFSRNLVLKLQNKLGLFHIFLQEKSQEFSLTVLESQNLLKFQDLDTESQISHFELILHNGRRKIHIGYRSDTKKIELVEYRRNGNQGKYNESSQLQREEYDKLLDMLPSLLGYVETFKKSCIIMDECTVENERTDLNETLRVFEIIRQNFSSNTKRKNLFLCTCFVFDPDINLKEMDQKLFF